MKLSSIAALAALTMVLASSSAWAKPVLETDFTKGDFASLGWDVKGVWSIVDYGASKPDLAKNPGLVAKYKAGSKTVGTLTKTFDPISNPASLTLTFDAGYGWGGKSHCQSFQVMLLDADGNGYDFDVHRANAKWGAQWAPVIKYGYNDPMTWASDPVDTTQAAIVDGAGLRTFTVTRDASGNWTFNGDGWTGGPVTFTDTTTTKFSQIVLRGYPNTDEVVFGKVKLVTDTAK